MAVGELCLGGERSGSESNFDSHKLPRRATNSIIAIFGCVSSSRKYFHFLFLFQFHCTIVAPLFRALLVNGSSAALYGKLFYRRIRKIHFYFPVTFSHLDSNFFFSSILHSTALLRMENLSFMLWGWFMLIPRIKKKAKAKSSLSPVSRSPFV